VGSKKRAKPKPKPKAKPKGRAQRRQRGKGGPPNPPRPNPPPPLPPPNPGDTWDDVIRTFIALTRLESQRIRLQVLKLVDELKAQALTVFELGRMLECGRPFYDPYDPDRLTRYGRDAIVAELNQAFAAEHIALANTDTLLVQLAATAQAAPDWYRQGLLLLDCAHTLRLQVAVYEYRLIQLRIERSAEGAEDAEGRAPSVAYDYLATEQERWGRTDVQVTASLVIAQFIPSNETFIARYQENVIKRHRLRRRARLGQNAE